MSIEAMKQALEALELIQRDIQWHDNSPTFKLVNNTVNALRTAIQQAESEPATYAAFKAKCDEAFGWVVGIWGGV